MQKISLYYFSFFTRINKDVIIEKKRKKKREKKRKKN